MARSLALASVALLLACPAPHEETSSSSAGTSGSSDSATSTTGPTGGTTAASDTASGTSGTTGDSSSAGSTSGGSGSFVQDPDGGSGNECDPRKQDCMDGEKCVAWANDGGNSWNANKCVDETGSGVAGDACTAEGSGVSGIDDCAKGFMCYQLDENNMGTCVAFCEPDDTCPPGSICANLNDGVLPICVVGCDPLIQDCPPGQGCYAVEEDDTQISCRTDASGAGGLDGDPCEFDNVCDPGLICAPNSAGCATARCCTPWCDLNEPNTCPGAAMGEECVPHSQNALPGLEHVGECVIPQ